MTDRFSYNIFGMKDGHSHYKNESGFITTDRACYYELRPMLERKEEVVVYLPYPDYLDIPYLNWMLNTEMFGSAFITKDADDGIYNGFRMQGTGDYTDDLFQLTALRFPYEFKLEKTWSALRDVGFNEMQALWLMTHVKVSHDTVTCWTGNSNHYLIKRTTPYALFNLESMEKGCGWVTGEWGGKNRRFPGDTKASGTAGPGMNYGAPLSHSIEYLKSFVTKELV